MKSAVAITLILSGVFIVALPPLSDAWLGHLYAGMLASGANSVNIDVGMPDLYRIGCFMLGAAMIFVGLAALLTGSRQTYATQSTAALFH